MRVPLRLRNPKHPEAAGLWSKTRFQAGLKTSLKSEGDDFTELFLSNIVAQGAGLKLTRTEKGAKNDLLEIRRIENTTHVRSWEFLWNADNLKKSLTRIETLSAQRSENLANVLKSRADAIRKRIKGLRESFRTATIDLDPSFEYIKNQIQALGKELRVDASKMVAKVEAVRDFLKKQRETIRESALANALDKISELIRSGKDTWPKILGQIRGRLDELSKTPDVDLDAMYSKETSELFRQVWGKFHKGNEEILKRQKKNPSLDKVAKMGRGALVSWLETNANANEDSMMKAFPFPEAKNAYQPWVAYLKQRIGTPEKKTLDAEYNDILVSKVDPGLKAFLANTLYANFAGGQVVVNVPVLTKVPFFKQFITFAKDKKGFGAVPFTRTLNAPGFAIIYGTKEFRTFDGKMGTFAGPNHYLLATDSVNQQFSVALDISKKDETEQKFIYLTDGKDSAVIAEDGTVFLNGKRSITGTKAGSLQVIREGYWDGVQSTTNGVTVECQRPGRFSTLSDLPCIVRISGYYHSKVTGALGFYNNDITDDTARAEDYII